MAAVASSALCRSRSLRSIAGNPFGLDTHEAPPIAVASGYEKRSSRTARFWLSRSKRSDLLLLGLVGAETRFHASTRISATQSMHLVCADEREGSTTKAAALARRLAAGEQGVS